MATSEEKQTVRHLATLAAIAKASNGARDFFTILEKGSGDRSIDLSSEAGVKLIVLSVASLKPNAPASEEGSEKPARSSAKATISVRFEAFLPDGEMFTIESFNVQKEGQASIALPISPSRYRVSVSVDGVAEYAVYGF